MFSSIWRAIKKIVSKILSFIKNFLKKFGAAILLIAAVWFAPAIAATLSSWGAPAWLSGAFSWIGTTLTPHLVSLGSWLGSGLAKVGTLAKVGWAALSFGQKAALVTGVAALIAPEEVGKVLEEGAALVGDVVGGVVGSVATGFISSPLGFALLAGALYFLFVRDRDRDGAIAGRAANA